MNQASSIKHQASSIKHQASSIKQSLHKYALKSILFYGLMCVSLNAMNKLRAFDPIQHEKAKATFTAKHKELSTKVGELNAALQNKAQEADKLLGELKKLNSTKAEELRIKVDALAKDLTTQIDGLLTCIPSIEDKSTTEEIQKATQDLLAAQKKYEEDAKSTLTTLDGNIATIKKAIKAIAEKTH